MLCYTISVFGVVAQMGARRKQPLNAVLDASGEVFLMSKGCASDCDEFRKRVTEANVREQEASEWRSTEKGLLFWGCSSDGRASEWHSEGQGFDSPQLHQHKKQAD